MQYEIRTIPEPFRSFRHGRFKSAIGKLDIRVSLDAFLDDAILRFDLLSVSIAHIRALAKLPLHHRDPFDRMLVAQACAEGMTLVTVDPMVRAYGVDCLPV